MAANAFAMLWRPSRRQADESRFAVYGDNAKLRSGRTEFFDVFRMEICHRDGYRFRRIVNGTSRKVASELGYIGIVGVQEGDCPLPGLRRKPSHQLVLCASHAGDAVGKSLCMRVAYVGDDTPVGRSDPAQRGNFSCRRHAHLDDRDLVLRRKLQKLQRQTKVVVQVALRLQHAKLRCQYGRNRFLGGRFAGRAGYGDDPFAPMAAYGRSERLQCASGSSTSRRG